jgi:hypothetical protein
MPYIRVRYMFTFKPSSVLHQLLIGHPGHPFDVLSRLAVSAGPSAPGTTCQQQQRSWARKLMQSYTDSAGGVQVCWVPTWPLGAEVPHGGPACRLLGVWQPRMMPSQPRYCGAGQSMGAGCSRLVFNLQKQLK